MRNGMRMLCSFFFSYFPPKFIPAFSPWKRARSTRHHPSYGNYLEVKREYYQNCSVLGCVTQCSQSAARPADWVCHIGTLMPGIEAVA